LKCTLVKKLLTGTSIHECIFTSLAYTFITVRWPHANSCSINACRTEQQTKQKLMLKKNKNQRTKDATRRRDCGQKGEMRSRCAVIDDYTSLLSPSLALSVSLSHDNGFAYRYPQRFCAYLKSVISASRYRHHIRKITSLIALNKVYL